MLQLQGPTPFLNQIQYVQTADGSRLVEQGADGNYYVKMKNSPVAIFLLVYYGTDYRDDIDNSGQFLFGFAKGLGAGGIGMVEGVWQIGKVAFKESTRISPMGFVFVMKYGDKYETEKRFFRTTAKVAETIGKIVWEIRNDRDQFVNAALNGNWNEADAISAKYRIALALGAELFVELYEVYMSLPPDQQGYYFGAAMFEIGSLAASYAKAPAKLAQIGAKTDFLNDLAKVRFFQEGAAKVALERTIGYAAGRLTTAMCFAAGTKVHTDNGLVDIEKIEKGDRVLSQDPATHRQEYKTVINTIVTRPSRLYHLSYRPRQPHRVGNDKKHLDSSEDSDEDAPSELTCTGEHPFYIVGRNDFVQASQIRAGDEVLLADGTAAVVTGTESEKVEEIGSVATFNIEVEGFHTYFVGLEGVWVHNNSTNPCGVIYDIYNYYRKFRKEGTLGPIEAFEKLEKTLPWNDMELMAKALEEILPEVITDIPVEKLWTIGRKKVAGTATKNMWWHYVEHVLWSKSFDGLEKEFPHITNAIQYILEARRFMDTLPGANIREWEVPVYIKELDEICVKVCRLDLDTGYFGVKWKDHPDDAGKMATFFRANRKNLTWRQWAEEYGLPRDQPF